MGRTPVLDAPAEALQLQLVRPRHREMMRRLICGETQRDIARDMGISEARLSIIVRSPAFQLELRRMEADVYDKAVDTIGDVTVRAKRLQPKALDTLEALMEDKKIGAMVRRTCAKDILDLAGATKKRDVDGMTDIARFISDAYTAAQAARAASEGNTPVMEPIPSEDPIDDAKLITENSVNDVNSEDDALISAPIIDVTPSPESSSPQTSPSSPTLADVIVSRENIEEIPSKTPTISDLLNMVLNAKPESNDEVERLNKLLSQQDLKATG